jgi:hypothetical protein
MRAYFLTAELRELLHLYVISVGDRLDDNFQRKTPDNSGRITGTCDCFDAMRLLLSGWEFVISRLDEPGSDRMDTGSRVDSARCKAKYCSKIEDLRAKR